MNEIFDMYQELIIDHSRSPKNFGLLPNISHHARGHNPLCGDVIDLNLLIFENIISNIAWDGDGCAISKASASLMTESVKGKTINEAMALFDRFHQMLVFDDQNTNVPSDLGKLMVLRGVRQFPMRVKCATLCWHTLNAALNNHDQKVTTE